MIIVTVLDNGKRLCKLSIQKISQTPNGELADYKIELSVERGNDVVAVSRKFLSNFPRKSVNSLGLLKAAINLFGPEDLALEEDFDDDCDGEDFPPNLEWRFGRSLPEIQAW